MAEYLPVKVDGDALAMTAGGTIGAGQLVYVKSDGNVAITTGALASVLGVAAYDVSSGALVTVFCEGVHELVASGTVTAGNQVESAAAGAVAAHTTGTNDVYALGVALTSATDGNKVRVAFK